MDLQESGTRADLGRGGRKDLLLISTSPGTSPGLKHDLESERRAVINTLDTINYHIIAEDTEIECKRTIIVCL